jgi:hypothetical protein
MKSSTMTLDQIRRAGIEVLARELGPIGMVRFLQQFETGSGDYTLERHDWLNRMDITVIADKIRQRRKK